MLFFISCSAREIAPGIEKQTCPGGFCDAKLPCGNFENKNMICTHNQCIVLCEPSENWKNNKNECPEEAKNCATYEEYSYCSDVDGLPIEICEE